MVRLSQVSKKLDDFVSSLLENKAPDYKKLGEVYHLSHYLPYKWYDERNGIYVSDNSLGLIFEVMPLVGNSEAMQKELSNIFTQILPEGSNIQIMFFASQNIRNDLLNYVYSRQNSSDTLQRLARRRSEFLDTLTQKSHLYPYVLRDFRVFLSINIPISGSFKATKEEIISIKKQIESTLNIVGMCYFLLKPTPLMELIDEIFNRDISKQNYDEVRRIWNPLDELSIQMLSQELDLKVEEDILKLHDESTEIKTFAINGYPPEWTLYQMGDLIGDLYRESRQFPFPYIFHYGIHIPKQSIGVAKIAVKANLVGKQLKTPIGKYIPDIERKYAELEFVQQNLAKGERLVNTRFGIVLFAPKDEMAGAEQILKTLFSSK